MDNKKTMLIVVGLVVVALFGWAVSSYDGVSESEKAGETVNTEAVDTESNSEETTK